MGDMFKLVMGLVLLVLLMILYKCYGFAQANGIETMVVFKTVLAIICMSALAIWAATQIGITEGFCFWLVSFWICLCPLFTALANVNTLGPSLYSGLDDPVWYGTWWFQWGFGAALVGLSAFLIDRAACRRVGRYNTLYYITFSSLTFINRAALALH